MAEPVPLSRVAAEIAVGDRSHVALVGGGGKTTLLGALCAQLRGRRIVTTTTKMGREQTFGLPVLDGRSRFELSAVLERDVGAAVVWSRIVGSKAIGVVPARCDDWFADSSLVDHVLVEADGSRRRPFKAPNQFEPVVASSTTHVVHVIGADALGRVIADQCHRPLRVAALAGCSPYERLTAERAASVVLHERGVRASVPARAEHVVVVTKVDTPSRSVVDEFCDAVAQHDRAIRTIRIARLESAGGPESPGVSS